MLLALLWLTVSTPFVYAGQQAQKEAAKKMCCATDEESNNLTNTAEEKSESGVNTLSEYLHEAHCFDHAYIFIITYYKGHTPSLHLSHSPELLSPPPEALS